MRAMGIRAAVLSRPDQVVAWPGSTATGEGSVFVTVPHRLLAGCRSTHPPRTYWRAEVDCSPEWLAEYRRRDGFGYSFEVEGLMLWPNDEDEPVLYAWEVDGDGPVSMRFNVNPTPEWTGRVLSCSAAEGYVTDDDGWDVTVEAHSKVGTITGLTRRLAASHGRCQPWATVFELGIDEALVLGDELQAMGRSMDGLVLTHAATREPMPPELVVKLGLTLGGLFGWD